MMPRLLASILLTSCSLFSQLAPGDVYREYVWRPTGAWQRVTGPDATEPKARLYLPNPVNDIVIGDLDKATKVVVVIEKLTSHAGTRVPRVRVNGNDWIVISDPSSSHIPGGRGTTNTVENYLLMRYPEVEVPLAQLREGRNTFEFTCQKGSALGRVWPQFIVYGVTFRVYYDTTKPRPTGKIVSPRPGTQLRSGPTFEVSASSSAGIKQVDVIGDYDDSDWRGENETRPWQHIYRYGEIRKHIGSATTSPYQVTWDTTWVPSQSRSFRAIARIEDNSGMVYVTAPVDALTLQRDKTVVRHLATQIPGNWRTFFGDTRHTCDVQVPDLAQAEEVKLFLTTWNGWGAREIGINDQKLVNGTGNDDLSHTTIDVPLSMLQVGKNVPYTYSNVQGHGIEVQWPGIEIFIRYDKKESQSHFVTFGSGCAGSNGVPTLGASSLPLLGSTFGIDLARAPANGIAILVSGFSNETFLTLSLPADLSPFGATGCFNYVSLDLYDPLLADGRGNGTIAFGIPNAPALIGIRLFHQFFVLDTPANQAGLTATNGGRMTIGDK